MISKIFLDLDDTLNSFTMFVLGKMGADVGPYDYHRFPDVGYDIVAALKVLTGRDMTPAEFWTSIPREFWSQAPRSLEFDSILGHCDKEVGLENTFILTSPTLCPESCAGKLEWIQREMPREMQRNFFIGPRKDVIAKRDYLLIDDAMRHLDAWKQAGGQTIVIPRPWNSTHSSNPYNRAYVAR
jgi:hypothetical protein